MSITPTRADLTEVLPTLSGLAQVCHLDHKLQCKGPRQNQAYRQVFFGSNS